MTFETSAKSISLKDKLISITMKNVFYFNVNYICNNRCKFCISHNTEYIYEEMTYENIRLLFENVQFSSTDLVVVNGGEPTLATDFYKIINYLDNKPCRVVVYSNGRRVAVDRIPRKCELIIPVHGDEITHNDMVQCEGAYEETISTLLKLNSSDRNFSVKFIISKEMIESQFSILDFLVTNKLMPQYIHIAKLNRSAKSNKNSLSIPSETEVSRYLFEQSKNLLGRYNIKLIDLAPCSFMKNYAERPLYIEDTPNVYFVQNNTMKPITYKKNICMGINCSRCKLAQACQDNNESYNTYTITQNQVILVERE